MTEVHSFSFMRTVLLRCDAPLDGHYMWQLSGLEGLQLEAGVQNWLKSSVSALEGQVLLRTSGVRDWMDFICGNFQGHGICERCS